MKKIIIAIILSLPFMGFAQEKQELTLQKAISIALEKNYGIVVQQKNVESATLQNTWGNAGVLPTISLSGSGSDSWSSNDEDKLFTQSLNASVNLNWTVFRGFGARIQKSKLDEMEKLYSGNLTITVENTISNAIMAYQNVLFQAENVSLAKKVMELSDDRYQQIQMKVDLGTNVTYDLLQAKNAYLQDKSNLLSATATYNNALRQLNFIMAVDVETKYEIIPSFQIVDTNFELYVLAEKLLSNNAQLKNQYINLELSKLDVKAARSAYYPTLSVGASSGLSSSDNQYNINSQLDNSNAGFVNSINANVSYSIYEGGRRKQTLQTSKISLEIMDVQTNEMKHELKNQLAQEFELYNVRKELVDLARENLEAAQLNLDLSKERFENGTINSFNYRDIQQLYLNTALSYQHSIFNLNESYYTLLRLTGGIIEVFN